MFYEFNNPEFFFKRAVFSKDLSEEQGEGDPAIRETIPYPCFELNYKNKDYYALEKVYGVDDAAKMSITKEQLYAVIREYAISLAKKLKDYADVYFLQGVDEKMAVLLFVAAERKKLDPKGLEKILKEMRREPEKQKSENFQIHWDESAVNNGETYTKCCIRGKNYWFSSKNLERFHELIDRPNQGFLKDLLESVPEEAYIRDAAYSCMKDRIVPVWREPKNSYEYFFTEEEGMLIHIRKVWICGFKDIDDITGKEYESERIFQVDHSFYQYAQKQGLTSKMLEYIYKCCNKPHTILEIGISLFDGHPALIET